MSCCTQALQVDSHGVGFGMWEAHWACMLLAGGATSAVLAVVLDQVLNAGALVGIGKDV